MASEGARATLGNVGTRERPQERAQRRTAELLAAAGREIRLAPGGAGLGRRDAGGAAVVSRQKVWRLERGFGSEMPLSSLSQVAAAVGLEATLRLYPGGDP